MDQKIFLQAGIDCEEGLRRFCGNAGLYAKVLHLFLEDASFSEIAPAMDEKNYGRAREKAHAVKGAAGNLGMKELYGLCVQFMQKLQEQDYTSAEALQEEMRRAYGRIARAVATL